VRDYYCSILFIYKLYMFTNTIRNSVFSKCVALFIIAIVVLPSGLVISPSVAQAQEAGVTESVNESASESTDSAPAAPTATEESSDESSDEVSDAATDSTTDTTTEAGDASTDVTSETTDVTTDTTDASVDTTDTTDVTTDETTTDTKEADTNSTSGGSAPALVGAPVLGSITVCKLIIDENENIVTEITSSLPAARFSVNLRNTEGSIADARFDTMEFAPNTSVVLADTNDAECETYSNLTAENTSYWYGEEAVIGPSINAWQTPKYDDLVGVHTSTTLESFYTYGSNVDSDGHIVLTQATPNRTVVVLNKYVPVTIGSITVCKMIIDGDNNVITHSDGVPAGTFSISLRTVSGTDLNTTTWNNSSFHANTNILTTQTENDSDCETYNNLPLTEDGYYYSQESITDFGDTAWAPARYDDLAVVHVNTTIEGSFYPYSGELFDADTTNDADRNIDSDGHIILTAVRPNRTLVVLNQFGINTDPCVDGVLTPAGFYNAQQAGDITFSINELTSSTTEATLHVTNNTGCLAPVSLTSYRVFDNEPTNNVLFANSGIVNVAETADITIALPECMAMVYAWYGQGVTAFTAQYNYVYPNVPFIIDKARHYATGPFCEPSANNAPVITVLGDNPFNILVGGTYTDPGATAADAEDGDITSRITASSTVDTSVAGTYTVTYRVTDNGGLSDEKTRTVVVSESNNGGGGGGGGSSSGSRRNGASGSRSGVGGSVLGEEIAPVACPYLNDYLHRDWNNNPTEVMKLQYFLKIYAGFTDLAVTGTFDSATFNAVSQFQNTYSSDVLSPWGHDASTGFVYILTKKKINEIVCQTAFPLNSLQEEEIAQFRALMAGQTSSTDSTNGSAGSASGIAPSGLNIDDVVGSTDTTNGIAESFEADSAVPNNIRSIASAIWSIPKDRGALLQSLYFLLIAIIAVYLATEIVVGSMNTVNLNKYKIWARKALGYIIGLALAIIVAVWYKVFSIVIPLIVLLIVAGAFLAVAMTKRNGDQVVSMTPNQK
jgi:cytoskeletal protein RodZ